MASSPSSPQSLDAFFSQALTECLIQAASDHAQNPEQGEKEQQALIALAESLRARVAELMQGNACTTQEPHEIIQDLLQMTRTHPNAADLPLFRVGILIRTGVRMLAGGKELTATPISEISQAPTLGNSGAAADFATLQRLLAEDADPSVIQPLAQDAIHKATDPTLLIKIGDLLLADKTYKPDVGGAYAKAWHEIGPIKWTPARYLVLGNKLRLAERNEEAIATYSKAVELYINDPGEEPATSYFDALKARYELGDIRGALETVCSLAKIESIPYTVLISMADFLMKNHDFKKAAEIYKKILKDPSFPPAEYKTVLDAGITLYAMDSAIVHEIVDKIVNARSMGRSMLLSLAIQLTSVENENVNAIIYPVFNKYLSQFNNHEGLLQVLSRHGSKSMLLAHLIVAKGIDIAKRPEEIDSFISRGNIDLAKAPDLAQRRALKIIALTRDYNTLCGVGCDAEKWGGNGKWESIALKAYEKAADMVWNQLEALKRLEASIVKIDPDRPILQNMRARIQNLETPLQMEVRPASPMMNVQSFLGSPSVPNWGGAPKRKTDPQFVGVADYVPKKEPIITVPGTYVLPESFDKAEVWVRVQFANIQLDNLIQVSYNGGDFVQPNKQKYQCDGGGIVLFCTDVPSRIRVRVLRKQDRTLIKESAEVEVKMPAPRPDDSDGCSVAEPNDSGLVDVHLVAPPGANCVRYTVDGEGQLGNSSEILLEEDYRFTLLLEQGVQLKVIACKKSDNSDDTAGREFVSQPFTMNVPKPPSILIPEGQDLSISAPLPVEVIVQGVGEMKYVAYRKKGELDWTAITKSGFEGDRYFFVPSGQGKYEVAIVSPLEGNPEEGDIYGYAAIIEEILITKSSRRRKKPEEKLPNQFRWTPWGAIKDKVIRWWQ